MAVLKCCLLAFIAIVCHLEISAAVVTFPDAPYTAEIAENAADGDTVTTITATPTTDGDMLVYTLVSQEPVTDPVIFAINGDPGVITVVDVTNLDFETHAEYKLTIKAAETGESTESATTTVTVTAAVNEPPIFAKETYTACVSTDSPAGTTVVQVTATDVDADDTMTYTITAGNTDDVFEVSEATGIIKIAAGKAVSDTSAPYSLTLVATDNGGETATATVTVSVEDPCPATTASPPDDSATATTAPGDSATATTAPGDSATATTAPNSSAMTAVIPFHILLVSVVLLLCQFFMKL